MQKDKSLALKTGTVVDWDEYVTLVAIHTTAPTLTEAQELAVAPFPNLSLGDGPEGWEEWWVADEQAGTRHVSWMETGEEFEVREIDGSDNDSAVFVDFGEQAKASRLLVALGLSGSGNIVGPDLTPEQRKVEILEAGAMLIEAYDRIERCGCLTAEDCTHETTVED